MDTQSLSAVDPTLLPPQIRLFVVVIGLPETVKLLKARGGTTLRIPKVADKSDVLPQILSIDAVNKLCSAMPGKILQLPKSDKILMQIRNKAIRLERQSVSAAQLALKYSLTRRQIINIAPLPEDGGQCDLFGEV